MRLKHVTMGLVLLLALSPTAIAEGETSTAPASPDTADAGPSTMEASGDGPDPGNGCRPYCLRT